MDADRLAFKASVIKQDAISLGPDLFEAEGDRGLAVQPGPPVGIQLGPAAMNLHALAAAFEPRVLGVEVEKRIQIAGPACIQPVHHNGNAVKIFGQLGILSARGLAPAPLAGGIRTMALNMS